MEDYEISAVTILLILVVIFALITWCRGCKSDDEETDQENLDTEDNVDVEAGNPPKSTRRTRRKWFKRRNQLAQPCNPHVSPPSSSIYTIEDFPNSGQNLPRNSSQAHKYRYKIKNHTSHQYLIGPNHRFHFPFKTLIIATDATPRHLGGYMINPFGASKRIEYYSVPTTEMPWMLQNTTKSGNPTEFEMKNLLSALILWEEAILKYRKVAIFTDNSAIIGNCKYGHRVQAYIRHLRNCRGVLHVNSELIYVNKGENLELFKEFITPADTLSRLNEPGFTLTGFEDCIMSYHYGIGDADFYQLKFNAIRRKIQYWARNPCQTCGFQILRSGSLKRGMY